MASKPPSPDDPIAASADGPIASDLEAKLAAAAAIRAGGKPAVVSAVTDDDEDDGDDDDLDEDDEDDEELVVFTAKEAAGALATIYAFVKPFLKNYKKIITLVGLGVLVETLFNVIMPLSLKFLIDDALGEEDFEALVKILSVLAVAGIVTSIVAVMYERWDAMLSASLISDLRSRLFEAFSRWAVALAPEQAERILQRAGLAAAAVKDIPDEYEDAQLWGRGAVIRLAHPDLGELLFPAPFQRLQRTPVSIRGPGARLGQDTDQVVTDWLDRTKVRA